MSGFTTLPERVFPQSVFAPDIWPNDTVTYTPISNSASGVKALSAGRPIRIKTLPRLFAHRRIRS